MLSTSFAVLDRGAGSVSQTRGLANVVSLSRSQVREGMLQDQNDAVGSESQCRLKTRVGLVCVSFPPLDTCHSSVPLSEWNILVDCLGIQFLDRIVYM